MDLKQQRNILEGATSGPWEVEGDFNKIVRTETKKYLKGYGIRANNSDCEAIAMMRNHYEAMLDLCEAVSAFNHKENCGMHWAIISECIKRLERIESIGE